MSADSIRLRIASALGIPPDDVEVAPPGGGPDCESVPGLVRVRDRGWGLSAEMWEQDEELINRVVVSYRSSVPTR
ncbi:MAG TPA: hypothetical protein VM597_37065 [Gemmataceae bacterium]|nr:hypothetical protein [Gemmataceae bacterium]